MTNNVTAIDMTNYRKEFLIAEYGSIMEHFRSYQSNRLNIILVGIPIAGAIALNSYEKEDWIVIVVSCLLLYGIPVCQILIDNVFKTRLRRYTRRLASIEDEFEVIGYSRMRLDEIKKLNEEDVVQNKSGIERKTNDDATTKSIRLILYFMSLFVTGFSTAQLYKLCYERRVHLISDPEPWISYFVFLPVIAFILLFFWIWCSVSTKGLKYTYDIHAAAPTIQSSSSESISSENIVSNGQSA